LKRMKTTEFSVDGVIFDLGSTLVEYENIPWVTLNMKCLEQGYQYLLDEDHQPPSFKEFADIYVRVREEFRDKAAETLQEYNIIEPIAVLLKHAGLDTGDGLPERFFEVYYQPVSQQLTIYADTLTVLKKIRQSGRKIGLVSNTIFPENYHREELERFMLEPLFDFTIFSSSFGYRKPHENIYGEAINLIDLPSERLLFVGDRYLEDYLGPRKSGMNAAIKYREGREYPDPMPEDVTVVKSLSELLPMIGIKGHNN